MKKQFESVINFFNVDDGKEVTDVVTSPAQKYLRDVSPDCNSLSAKRSESFHFIVATLLWIMKRARLNLETSVFVCVLEYQRVMRMIEKKLKRVTAYVKGTIDNVMIIGADSLSTIFTWIEATYAVTADMKIQTAGAMSLGLGILHGKSSKQKLNVKSSTEAELVGISDCLPYNIWLLMCIYA